MSYKQDYYWRNKEGKIVKTVGIELTIEEKLALAKKNNEFLEQQRNDGKFRIVHKAPFPRIVDGT